MENLKETYNYLLVDEKEFRITLASKNIKRELKNKYPKAKFSIRRSGNSIDINYTNGPSFNEVELIINKYVAGKFDCMTDSYDCHTTEFIKLFGSADYIFIRRLYTEDIIQKVIEVSGINKSSYTFADGRCYIDDILDSKRFYNTINEMSF